MKGLSVHSQVKDLGLESDIYVASSLVNMYAKCGSLENARTVFNKMKSPNVVLWNSLLLGCVENGESELALQLFDEMKQRQQQQKCAPDERTFISALTACSSIAVKGNNTPLDRKPAKLYALEKAMAIHCEAARSHFDSHRYVASTLVDTYAKCGSMLEARRVFDRMAHHELVDWNALVRGYAENNEAELALCLYERMKGEGYTPDTRTFLAALTASGNLAALESGRRIHDDVRRCQEGSDTFVANALINFYGKCGSMADSQSVFDLMEPATRNLVTWSALISGYSRLGDTDRVFELFQKMQRELIQPDGITLMSVLTACSHSGLADEGKLLFETMEKRFGITPDIGHYNCLVDILGRANRLDEAIKVATTMPFKASALTWRTVLSACHKWNNARVARLVFRHLRHLDDAASYVLLANVVPIPIR